MIEKIKEIRERLEEAVTSKDWWVVKSQMNKLDTLIYQHESKVKKLNIPDVIKSVCIAPKGECDRKPEDVCKECECCKYLEQTVL